MLKADEIKPAPEFCSGLDTKCPQGLGTVRAHDYSAGMSLSRQNKFLNTPTGAMIFISLLVLGVEFLIMVLLEFVFKPMPGNADSPILWQFFDAVLLTCLVTPVIYALTVRPLKQQQVVLQKQFNELSISAVTFESQEGIIVTDAHNNILKVNHSFTEITGYTNQEAIGKTPAMLKSGRQAPDFYPAMWKVLVKDRFWSGEIWNRRKNGEIYPEWLTITAVLRADGQVTNYVGIFSDITERKALDAEIQLLAFYDPLTQLPNRRLLLNRLEKALAATTRNGQYGALMMMDLDHFKTLNDLFGHHIGDQLLIEVAKRITGCIREQDSASRFGGDEFVMMLEDLSEDAELAALQAESAAKKILAILSEPYNLQGSQSSSESGVAGYSCTSSIGVALFQGQRNDIATLLKWADMAMYQAKSSGRNAIRFFDPVMQSAIENRANLEADLRASWGERQFEMYYQIQVDHKNRPVGAETLIRWRHPLRGLVAPNEFIPLAEEIGLIVPMGQWVIESACVQLDTWQRDPAMRRLHLSVNVSAKQFFEKDFVESVKALVRKNHINPLLLKLELTESAILNYIDDAVIKMQALKDFGVTFSLDDFGTGYSSLSYLKRLPLDQIKIDKAFVRNITHDKGDVAMVHAIVDLGMNFGLEIIAEGVETVEQLRVLQRYGCSHFQGYLFSKPVSVREFEHLIGDYRGSEISLQ